MPNGQQVALEKVQRWVISALITAVTSFPIGALVAASIYRNRDGGESDAIALTAMAGIIGILAVAAGRLVHRLNPLSPYVLCGALPAIFTMMYLIRSSPS